MQWMEKVQTVLGDLNMKSEATNNALVSAAIGGIFGALLAGKTGRKIAGNALMVGGGAVLASVLWNKYKPRPQSRSSIYEMQEASTAALDNQKRLNRRMVRLITAMIFAAKSDGVIDDKEHMAIRRNVEQLQLDTGAEDVIQHALIQPLDPSLVAKDVESEEEPIEVHMISCSVIEIDHFMENSYLDALAVHLGIPASVTANIRSRVALGSEHVTVTSGG